MNLAPASRILERMPHTEPEKMRFAAGVGLFKSMIIDKICIPQVSNSRPNSGILSLHRLARLNVLKKTFDFLAWQGI